MASPPFTMKQELPIPNSASVIFVLCMAALFCFFLSSNARANVPGGIVSGTTAAVTLTSGANGPTLSNGIVQIVCTTNGAVVNQVNYTYNNGSGTKTKQLLLNGKDGGELYWEFGGYGGSTWTYTDVVDPSTNGGSYAEVAFTSLASGTAAAGDLQVNFSMLRGSPGFYVTLTMTHHSGDIATGLGEMRTNIYIAPDFNWMSVSPVVQRELGIGAASVPSFDAPQECYLYTSGIDQGTYDDKYKFSQIFGTERVWGWGSINDPIHGVSGGANVGIWNVLASSEYYNGGPLKPELMDAPMVNMTNGGHYNMGSDSNWSANEQWTRVQGPYFVYCNNISPSITDPVQASQALYNDAVAQGVAEASGSATVTGTAAGSVQATAWPYAWFNNATYDSNYAGAAQRGTVTGRIVISDTGNPNASGSNLWVGVVQQPATADNVYDFQLWYKPYQFWVKSDANGNFTIPSVIAGSNYTLYAFGQGANGTFMSQNQSGGNPPWSKNLPASPFSVTVSAGATTALGNIAWAPTRIGPTVFEIGYPDRTGHKFRHGDDWWVGDIGPSPSAPSPIWTKFYELPFDFPNGVTYSVGTSRWPTDWFFIQPILTATTGGNNSSSSNITFTLPSSTSLSGSASLYLGIASDYYAAVIVSVNGTTLVSNGTTIVASPSTLPSTGFTPSYTDSDTSIREGCNAAFSDERITFPASLLKSGTNINTVTLGLRQVGGSYFADHFMYDYLRLELTGYVPPAPANVLSYPGNGTALVSWPVTPGATSYNVLRSTTPGSNYAAIASGSNAVIGPVCGSGPSNATYIDTTATNGTPYYYAIQSVNPVGTSVTSTTSNPITPTSSSATTPPPAPTGISAVSNNGTVALSWQASSGANYYTIQRTTALEKIPNFYTTPVLTSTTTLLSTITLSNTVTALSYVDSSVTKGTEYLYTVLATNAAGTSGTTATVMAKPLPSGIPSTPPTVVAIPGNGTVTLDWSAVAGAVGYLVSSSTSANGPFTYDMSVADLTYTQTGLASDTTYYYQVSALNAAGVTSATQVSTTTPPSPPSNLNVIPGNTQNTITWGAIAAATDYVVESSTISAGPYNIIGTPTGPSYTNSGLTNGVTYYYVVASVDADGTGPVSTQASGTPTAAVPPSPTLYAIGSAGQVALNWTSITSATSYSVLSASRTGGPYASVATVSGTTYINTGLPNAQTFYYVVYASNASGPGAYSNEASAVTGTGSPSLIWTASNSANWDTTTANWTYNGSAATYADGDSVLFPDTASSSALVLSGTVSPGSVTFNNSLLNYSLTGGAISGTCAVTKYGAGTLTFSNLSTFSGGLLVYNGAVTVASGDSAGSGLVTLAQNATFNMNTPLSNSVQLSPASVATVTGNNLSNSMGSTYSGDAASTLVISGNLSFGASGSAQFANMYGLVDLTPGTTVRFASGNGPNGNGGANATFQVDGSMYPRNNGGAGGIVLGALSGAGSLSGQSTTPTGSITYFIGSNNLSTLFSGAITNSSNGTTAINKMGTGTLILSGDNSYTGITAVTAGILEITGTLIGTTGITISGSGSYYQAGGNLNVAGSITNNGIFKISGNPSITLAGTFTNNGVLDLINGPSSLPVSFVNNGTVLTSGSGTAVSKATLAGAAFTISMPTYVEHTYQLARTTSLTNPNWTAVGVAQPGTGSPITLQDPAVTGSAAFYKVLVSP
jgi:autotransporter-associated beta strand protein